MWSGLGVKNTQIPKKGCKFMLLKTDIKTNYIIKIITRKKKNAEIRRWVNECKMCSFRDDRHFRGLEVVNNFLNTVLYLRL